VAVAQAPDADFRSGGFTELHAAARSGDVQRIRDLVDAGAKVDVPSDFGTTPLHSAAISSQIEAIRALISLGANTEARDSMGRTPLFVTVEVNSKPRATLEALLEAGASAEARNKFGKTPLEACWTEEAREVLSRHLSEAGSR
jgi:ankyrin repeat protein